MSMDNFKESLKNHYPAFVQPAPGIFTVPSEEPLFLFMFPIHKLMCLTANIGNNSVVIKVLFIHQDSIKCVALLLC
jgi:hypothetical protein